MSNELNLTQSPDTVNPEQPSSVDKQEHMIPKSRLDEVLSQKRSLEAKIQAFEAEKQTANEKDLSFKEKYEKLNAEYTGFKANVVKQQAENQFISKAKELGFPEKIAKLGVPKEITEDSIDAKLKEFEKEYKEFLPVKEEKKPPVSTNPFVIVQPNSNAPVKVPTRPGTITGKDITDSLKNTF
jgi:chromosome segregation ATPase